MTTLKLTEYLSLSKDGQVMVLLVNAEQDAFLDLLNELTGRGYQYQVISKQTYYYLRDIKGVKGYTVK